jgi:hypothetical protein
MDSSSKKLSILLLNMTLVLLCIGAAYMVFASSLADISGEYFCGGQRLGNMRLSIKKNGHDLKGSLEYSDRSIMELVPEYSSIQANNQVQLTFEIPKRLLKRYKAHHITFKGDYSDGTISGTIEDLGGLYPTKFERNPFATVLRNFVH